MVAKLVDLKKKVLFREEYFAFWFERMGSNHFSPTGPREAIQVVSVSTFSVVEMGNVQRKTVRHDGYSGVWVCVETVVLLLPFGLLLLHSWCRKWYAMLLPVTVL